ncbi:MAG: hypothetical protein WCC81_12225, partial [Pseudolabrys sp.]
VLVAATADKVAADNGVSADRDFAAVFFKLMLARALSRPRYCFGGHYFQQNFTSASLCLRVT